MTHEARREAAERVARDHRPLAVIFAELRGEPPPEVAVAPPPLAEAAAPAEIVLPPEPELAVEPEPEAEAGLAVEPELVVESEPELAVEPEPEAFVAAASRATDESVNGIDTALRRAVATLPGTTDPDEVAFDLAMAIEPALAAAAEDGARLAYLWGVPRTAGPGDAGLDIAPDALRQFAEAVVADGPHAAARLVRDTARRLAERAANAGLAAVTRAAGGWAVAQRFGEPYCPAAGCYGHNGREVLPEHGVPPYAEDCNCGLEPVSVAG